MRDIGELLGGVAALLWPLVAIFVILVFRDQVRDAIARTHRAEPARLAESEIGRRLDEVQATAAELEDAAPPTDGSSAVGTDHGAEVTTILQAAAANPRAGLMLASSELETAIGRLLSMLGDDPDRPVGLRRLARDSRGLAGLPAGYGEAFDAFDQIRETIVRGTPPVENDDVLRAVDLGLTLLRLVRGWPHERNTVLASGLQVYSDAAGTRLREDVSAVLLGRDAVDRFANAPRVFPTTRSYERGQWVSWEWNNARFWGESWYRDPAGDIKYGWTRSFEFVGRALEGQ